MRALTTSITEIACLWWQRYGSDPLVIGSIFNVVASLERRTDASKHRKERQAAITTNCGIDL
jgi:hypothetical protein